MSITGRAVDDISGPLLVPFPFSDSAAIAVADWPKP